MGPREISRGAGVIRFGERLAAVRDFLARHPWVLPLLGLIVVTDLQIRFFLPHIREPVFWRDEANSLAVATLPVADFFRIGGNDVNGFTYLLILRLWCSVFGTSEIAARSLSCLAMLLVPIFTYRASRRWFGDRLSAAVASLLLVSSPLFLTLHIGQARPYALALATTAFAFDRLTLLQKSYTKSHLLGFGLAVAMMCNASPANLPLAVAMVVVWCRPFISPSLWRQHQVLRLLSVPLITLAASAPILMQSFRFSDAPTGHAHSGLAALTPRFFAKFSLESLATISPAIRNTISYAMYDYIGEGVRAVIAAAAPWFVLLAPVALTLILAWTVVTSAWIRLRWHCIDVVLVFAVPIVFAAVGSLFDTRMVDLVRNFTGIALGATLLTVMILHFSRSLLVLLGLLTLWRTCIMLPIVDASMNGIRSDGRAAAQLIESAEKDNDLVLLANPQLSPAFSYYYHGNAEQIHHPYRGPLSCWDYQVLGERCRSGKRTEETASALRKAAEEGRRVWFLTSGSPPPEPQRWWYCPDSLPVFEGTLNELFDLENSVPGTVASEPFNVHLYTPK